MKIRIVKPEVNAIANHWGYPYEGEDTVEIDIDEAVDKWLKNDTSVEGYTNGRSFSQFLQEQLSDTST